MKTAKTLIFTQEESEILKQKIQSNISIDEQSGCWNWLDYKLDKGYGIIFNYNKFLSVHRVSYTIFKGQILDGLIVIHTCDNTSCCNPDHLRLGTQKDNIHDMMNKERDKNKENGIRLSLLSYKRYNTKSLTEDQVRQIRIDLKEDIYTYKEISLRNNCTYKQVEHIKRNERYKNIY